MPKPNLIENPNISRGWKTYLGDGLYAIWYEGSYWIQSYNGVEILDSVVMDEQIIDNLVKFHEHVERLRGVSSNG